MKIERLLVLLSALVLLCSAAAAAALVDLPLGDVNVVVLTDVHSWIAGHGTHEPIDNANYGDVLSFYERLQHHEKDFFLVNDGDFMDGTGLSTYPPQHLTPLLERMPWDAFNMGNHELYFNSTIEHITKPGGFIDYLNGRYLTSNVVIKETDEPIGSRYTYLYGKKSNTTILTFGFLFDFLGNCNMTTVHPVEQTVQEPWFTDVLRDGSFDAILVLAHMDVQDPLVYVILNAIRKNIGQDDMPIVFITGHSHHRGYAQLDGHAISFEAGRFLDTVGFVSFSPQQQDNAFRHVFLDANVDTLKNTLGVETLATPSGAALSNLIHETQKELGLLQVLGCAPQSYFLNYSLDDPQSLWGLYLEKVIEAYFLQHDTSSIYVQGTGAFRYSLLEGNVTVDDVISVSPFNDTVYMVANHISGAHLLQILGTPNHVDDNATLPQRAVAGTIEPTGYYKFFVVGFELAYFQEAVLNVTGERIDPVPQYRDGRLVTTTGLWLDYVSCCLRCHDPVDDTGSNRSWTIVVLSALVAVMAFVAWWTRKRYARRGEYELIVDETENSSCRAIV